MVPLVPNWSQTHPFNTVWQDHLQGPVQRTYNAEIEVVYTDLTGSNAPVFDPETGNYTYPDDEVQIFRGRARVQPTRTATEKGGTQIQTLLVSVSQLDLDVRPKNIMRVLSCAENPVLENYKYVVYEITDSSNPIERTFYVKQDVEVGG